ncbi:MAG: MATE family efflux transporter [Bacteroidales bacterium]|nr:MATE family efflux transporter [Bacteroidales bacterium]
MINQNTEQLEHERIGRLLLSYSLPAIIASTASSLYNIIDRVFIGHGVGPLAISGLALTMPIMNLATALGTLVGAGASATISIRMGEQRRDDAVHILGNALILNLIISVVFSVLSLVFLDEILLLFGASERTLPYARDFMRIILAGNVITHIFFGLNSIMRASGYPVKAMVSILLTVTVNVILAPIFIFGLELGIRGAAMATVISQSVGMIWVISHFCNRKTYIRFEKGCFKLDGKIISDTFAIGLAPFIVHVFACLIAVIVNWLLKYHGGDLAVGAFSIVNSVAALVIMIIFGFTQGMQPIVGYNYGAGQYQRVRQTLQLTVLYGTVIGTLGCLASLLFPEAIANAFTNGADELTKLTVDGLRIFMLAYPVVGFQIVVSQYFQAMGKARLAILLSLTRQVFCLIPFLFLGAYFFQLPGIWAAEPAADFISAIITAWVLFRFNKKHFFSVNREWQ